MSTILYDTSDYTKTFIDQFTNPYIFQSLFIKNKNLFIRDNYDVFQNSTKYNFRPDLISYEVYGDEMYYPIILFCNQVGSIIQFRMDKVGNSVLYLKPELIQLIK